MSIMEHREYVVMQDGYRLDQIVISEMGDLDWFEYILELNIKSIQSELYIKQGTRLLLPVVENSDVKKVNKLW